MPSNEFQRIVRDLGVLGDTCTIGVSKEGVRFMVSGDLGELLFWMNEFIMDLFCIGD